jgi:hypothetical protein
MQLVFDRLDPIVQASDFANGLKILAHFKHPDELQELAQLEVGLKLHEMYQWT